MKDGILILNSGNQLDKGVFLKFISSYYNMNKAPPSTNVPNAVAVKRITLTTLNANTPDEPVDERFMESNQISEMIRNEIMHRVNNIAGYNCPD